MKPSATGVTNLLRVARAECAGAVAFAAVTADDAGGGVRGMRVFSFPQGETAETLSGEVVAELVRQAALDPEYAQSGVFVRSVGVRDGLTLAVAPLRDAGTEGMLGVVALDDQGFDQDQLELLQRQADRLARHLRARGDVDAIVATAASASETELDEARERVRIATPLQTHAAAPTTNGAGAHDQRGAARAERGVANGPGEPAKGGSHEPHPAGQAQSVQRPAVEPPRAAGTPTRSAPSPAPGREVPAEAWAAVDAATGLPSLAQFFSRAGRLLASEARATSALALVLVEMPEDATASVVARALSTRLRHTDPLVRIEPDLFAAAVLLFPGSTRGDVVEERLAGAVRASLEWLMPVRTTHVLAEPGDRRDVDELLREAIARLGR